MVTIASKFAARPTDGIRQGHQSRGIGQTLRAARSTASATCPEPAISPWSKPIRLSIFVAGAISSWGAVIGLIMLG